MNGRKPTLTNHRDSRPGRQPTTLSGPSTASAQMLNAVVWLQGQQSSLLPRCRRATFGSYAAVSCRR